MFLTHSQFDTGTDDRLRTVGCRKGNRRAANEQAAMHMIRLCNKEYPCPCCGYMSFEEPPGSYSICQICFWEDDAVQLRPDWWNFGGANPPLRFAQWQYQRRLPKKPGVRAPREPVDGDVRDPHWYPLPERPPVIPKPEDLPSGLDYFNAIDVEDGQVNGTPYYWRWPADVAPPRPAEFR